MIQYDAKRLSEISEEIRELQDRIKILEEERRSILYSDDVLKKMPTLIRNTMRYAGVTCDTEFLSFLDGTFDVTVHGFVHDKEYFQAKTRYERLTLLRNIGETTANKTLKILEEMNL